MDETQYANGIDEVLDFNEEFRDSDDFEIPHDTQVSEELAGAWAKVKEAKSKLNYVENENEFQAIQHEIERLKDLLHSLEEKTNDLIDLQLISEQYVE